MFKILKFISWLNVIKRKFNLNILNQNKNLSSSSIIQNSKLLKINNGSINDPNILIIGAGISGLSAAECLIQNGITNVQVIEASTRIGGRINSIQFGDAICELGAKWINETESEDSIHKIISTNDFPKQDIQKYEKICLTSNSNIVDNDLSYSIASAFSNIINRPISNNNIEQNSKRYLQDEIEKIIKDNFDFTDDIVLRTFLAHRNHLSGYFGNDLSTIHTNYLNQIARSFTKPVFMPYGMSRIVEHLITNIGKNRIILGKPIGTIQWANLQSLDGSLVHFLDGTIFVAKHIIFTLPLGALKIFHHLFFNPILPKQKLDAIFSLGFGYPTKLYLKYDHNIHDWLPRDIRLIWSLNEINNRSDWSTNITEISTVPNSKNVIEVKVSGGISEVVERLTDDVIKKGVTKVLRRFLNNYYIPFPNEILRSYWNSDVKYFGGIPFLSTLSQKTHINQLASPIYSVKYPNYPVLLFAGDATTLDGFGTLDGARKSGIREAMRIVKLYKNSL